jgi:hypothetical protein
MNFEDFAAKASEAGYLARFERKRRWTIICGKYTVNYFPNGPQPLLYVYRPDSIVLVPGDKQTALDVATSPPPPPDREPFSKVPRASDLSLFKKRALDQDPRCYICGIKVDWYSCSVDHLVPLFRGGGNNFKNLRLCCRPCNSWKGSRLMVEVSQQAGIDLCKTR